MRNRVIAAMLCMALLGSLYGGTQVRGKINAQNLVQKVEERPEEDYVITTYEPIQRFSFTLFKELLKKERAKQKQAIAEEKNQTEELEQEKESVMKPAKEERTNWGAVKQEDWRYLLGLLPVETEDQKEEIEIPTWVNPVISPVSVYLTMAMAGVGSSGETRAEFDKVLGQEMLHYAADLMERFPKDEETVQLQLANSIWFDTGIMPKKTWLESVAGKFQGEAYCSDLAAEGTKADMNRWIDAKSDGGIPEMRDENLPEGSSMALCDTVHFQADWETPFQGAFTTARRFTTTDGTKKKVPTMLAYEQYVDYFQDEHGDGILLPYADSSLAFLAMRPAKGEDVRTLIEELTMEELSYLLEARESTLVNLELPKLQVTYDMTYNDLLETMGIQLAFTPEADFSMMGTTESINGLSLSQVQQKIQVQVAEEGTTEAVSTEASMTETAQEQSGKPRNVFFREPFVYLILDTATEVPLYLGIVDDPTYGVTAE